MGFLSNKIWVRIFTAIFDRQRSTDAVVQPIVSFDFISVCTYGWKASVASGASSLKKEVCRGRAAFDITSQHETTLSLKTGNRPMNLAMLPKHYIGKIPPIYSISAICAHKLSVWKPKLLPRLWLINANSLYCSLRRAVLRLHQVVRNIQTAPQSSQ